MSNNDSSRRPSTRLSGPVRVRFPPSPTGFLHVGGARTAIYNDLLRHSLGGAFVLRIEDTDAKRSDEAMTRQILSALDWLGIVHDEGPFLQSDRVEEHRAAAFRLLAKGEAYHSFESQEEIDVVRKEVLGRGDNFRYKTSFPPPPREEVERRVEAGEPYAIRLRMPDGAVHWDDLVRGPVEFPADGLDDFIILRSDGSPTYHLSVVCDDVDSRVTHILRGEDHISNTPKHIALYRAFGVPLPEFGHMPLIMGTDRKRLSKRSGATSVEEFRDQGILPQALYNYLALLGWSPGGDREVMSRQEMIETFTVERLVSSAAIFDYDKLAWMSSQYMSGESLDAVLAHFEPFLAGAGLADADRGRLRPIVDLYRQRAKNLRELAERIVPFFRDEIDYDADLCAKFFQQPELPDLLDALVERYAAVEPFDVEGTEAALRGLAEERDVKAGVLIHPTRAALTNAKAGPPLFDVVAVMGRDESLRHLRNFVAYLRRNPPPDGDGASDS
jgi:glutamyl-tRNA synthetase